MLTTPLIRRLDSIVATLCFVAISSSLATMPANAAPQKIALSSSKEVSAVEVKVTVADPTMLAGKSQLNYVRVGLSGSVPTSTRGVTPEKAAPINVAIVIDTSSSMQGSKIEQARNAAITAIDRLRDQDIVSVVLYDSTITVLVPATKAVDREQIKSQIRTIRSNGSTALFAGVSKGAAEVRKFLDKDSINRVILLSDGQANIGPSSPRELERLGGSLVKEGISVTTLGLGLGYNEDLMSGLAAAASGNHLFVEDAQNLVDVFNREFNDLMSVVASDFKIKITTAENVRPIRVLGTKAEIVGRDVYLPLAQLYADQERYFVLETEVDSEAQAKQSSLVDVDVTYRNLITQSNGQFQTSLKVQLTDSKADVEKYRDYETYASCQVQIANEENKRATILRDSGRVKEAQDLLISNTFRLESVIKVCRDNDVRGVIPDLQANVDYNRKSAQRVKEKDWNSNRKQLRLEQYEVGNQQRSYPLIPTPEEKSLKVFPPRR